MEIKMTVVADLGNSKTYMRVLDSKIITKNQIDTSKNTEERKQPKKTFVELEENDLKILEETEIAEKIIGELTTLSETQNMTRKTHQQPNIKMEEFDSTIQSIFDDLKRTPTHFERRILLTENL